MTEILHSGGKPADLHSLCFVLSSKLNIDQTTKIVPRFWIASIDYGMWVEMLKTDHAIITWVFDALVWIDVAISGGGHDT